MSIRSKLIYSRMPHLDKVTYEMLNIMITVMIVVGVIYKAQREMSKIVKVQEIRKEESNKEAKKEEEQEEEEKKEKQ